MSDKSFTPGPWRVEHRHHGCGPGDDERHGLGLEIVGPPEATNRGQFERSADARLIAAAPELYEACKLAKSLLEFDAMQNVAPKTYAAIVGAIDKAETNTQPVTETGDE